MGKKAEPEKAIRESKAKVKSAAPKASKPAGKSKATKVKDVNLKEKKDVKRLLKITVPILAVVVVVIIGIWLSKHLGLGNGFGKGHGSSNTGNTTSTVNTVDGTDSPQPTNNTDNKTEENDGEKQDPKTIIVELTVEKDKYYFNNKPVELDAFIEEIKKMDGVVFISITDSEATKNAYDNLIKTLKEHSIQYSNSQ